MSWESISSDPGLQAIIALCFFFLLAIAWGGIHNRRRAQRLLETLGPVLSTLGQQTHVTWKGSAGFSAEVETPRAPFRKLTLVTHMLPRERFPVLWTFLWLLGRRDVLRITGTLRSSPRAQMRLGSRRRTAGAEEGWHPLDTPGSPSASLKGGNAAKVSAALRPLVGPSAARLQRLSLGTTAPHLQAEVATAGLDQERLAALFTGLTELCRAAQTRPSTPAHQDEDKAHP